MMITKEQITENASMIATIINTAEEVMSEKKAPPIRDMTKVIAYEHIMRTISGERRANETDN